MRCNECLMRIEDYLDGELDPFAAAQVAKHINDCAQCASEYQRLAREQEFYLRCETSVEVNPAFWSGVNLKAPESGRTRPARRFLTAHAIFERFASLRLSPAFTALIVMVAVAATVAVMRYTGSRESAVESTEVRKAIEPDPAPVAPQSRDNGAVAGDHNKAAEERAPNDRRPADHKDARPRLADRRAQARPGKANIEQLVREAEQKYLTAIAILSRDIDRRRSRTDPEIIAQLERSLAAIDRAIADTRGAARERPADPVAIQYMLAAYAKKVEMLKDMANN